MLRKMLFVLPVALLTLMVGCTGLSASNKNSSSSVSTKKIDRKTNKIVFLEYGGESSYSLQTMNSDGTSRETIASLPVTILPTGLTFSLRGFQSLSRNGKLVYCDGKGSIHVLDIETKNDINVSQKAAQDSFSDKPNDTSPAISADGQTIVFRRLRSGRSSLCIASSDGSNLQEFKQYSPEPSTFPCLAYSPDGQKIAFYTSSEWNQATGKYEQFIKVIDRQGVLLAASAPIGKFDWMSDNQRMITISKDDVGIINYDGTNRSSPLGKCITYELPLCSPDGKTLLTTGGGGGGTSENIVVVDLNNKSYNDLTNSTDRSNASPIYIEQGKRIAFISYPKGAPASQGDIWVMSINGEKKTNITNSQSHYRLVGWMSE